VPTMAPPVPISEYPEFPPTDEGTLPWTSPPAPGTTALLPPDPWCGWSAVLSPQAERTAEAKPSPAV